MLSGCDVVAGIDPHHAPATCADTNSCAAAPTCTDGIQNGLETDVDCGGPDCGACALGASCSMTGDCATGRCTESRCAYPTSCLDLHSARPDLGDGMYTIDPSIGIQPLSVYCDMTTDGGGWTLVHMNNLSSTNDRTDSGYNPGALVGPAVNDVAVLPRATIAAISPAREFRVLATNGYKIYSLGGMPYYTTDNHTGMSYTGMVKYDWAAAYAPQSTEALAAGNMHATVVCPAAGCLETGEGVLATQRWCCGAPNAGFWLDGAARFQAGYYAGTGWMR